MSQVNKIKPTMSSAKLYCSTDVVERLSRPPGSNAANTSSADDIPTQYFDAQSAANERPIMDMSSFMASLGGQPGKASASGFDTPSRERSSTPSGKGDKAKRDAKFEMFLARQQANLKKREESVKQVHTAAFFCLTSFAFLSSLVFLHSLHGDRAFPE